MSFSFNFGALGKAVAMVAGVALAGSVAGCSAENVSFGDKKGVPLSELDLTGDAPTAVALMGPDVVKVTEGDKLAIEVEASDEMSGAMRFALDGGTLGILRSKDAPKGETATILVTMPAPTSLVIAGSGRIETANMAPKAEVTIAGSGAAITRDISGDSLEVNIMGSGSFAGSGSVKTLEMQIAGSGSAAMKELSVESAEVNIAGSGDGVFRSDGKVEANIMGSGTVRVIGRAKCEVSSVGSGKLVCESEAEPAE